MILQVTEPAVIHEPEINSEKIKNAIGRTPDWFHVTERTWQLKGSEQETEFAVQFALDGETFNVRGSSTDSIIRQIKGRSLTMYEQRERMKIELEDREVEAPEQW